MLVTRFNTLVFSCLYQQISTARSFLINARAERAPFSIPKTNPNFSRGQQNVAIQWNRLQPPNRLSDRNRFHIRRQQRDHPSKRALSNQARRSRAKTCSQNPVESRWCSTAL